MPYPNEHSCRVKSPDQFQDGSFRRINAGDGDNEVSLIVGRPHGADTTEIQAIRYGVDRWSVERARVDCEEKGGMFEPAAVKSSIAYPGIALSDVEETHISEIQVLRPGTFHHSDYGELVITEETLERMVANYRSVTPRPPTQMVVDYEHQSTYEGILAEAAGWVEDIYIRDGSLWARVSWTSEAAHRINERKYRYISPHFALEYQDSESGAWVGPTMLSIALVNRPFIEGMTPVTLSGRIAGVIVTPEEVYQMTDTKTGSGTSLAEQLEALQQAGLDQIDGVNGNGGNGDETPPVETPDDPGALVDTLRALLGVEDNAHLLAQVQKLVALQNEVAQLKQQVATLNLRAVSHMVKEAKDEVHKAIVDRKIVPAQGAWAEEYALKDPEGFQEFLAGAVPISFEVFGVDGADAVVLTTEERRVAQQLGVTEEALMAAKKKMQRGR